jgi:hypothetical protein
VGRVHRRRCLTYSEAETSTQLPQSYEDCCRERIFNVKNAVEPPPVGKELYHYGNFNRGVMEKARFVDSSFLNNTVKVGIPSLKDAKRPI